MSKIVDELNSLQLNCDRMSWEENIPDAIWDKYFEGNTATLDEGLDVDTRRWFETSTTVVKLIREDVTIGIDHVTNFFSESMTVSDCESHMTFTEMEPVETVTYKAKK